MVLTLLHLIALPIVIIASLINGLAPIAIVDILVFLGLTPVELMLWRINLSALWLGVRSHGRPHVRLNQHRRAVGYQGASSPSR